MKNINHLLAIAAFLAALTFGSWKTAWADCTPNPSPGNDVITCTGSVPGGLNAEDGDDQVTLFGSVSVGGSLVGEDGNDTLIFDLVTSDRAQYNNAKAAIAGNAGGFAWDDGFIRWEEFEVLVDSLTYVPEDDPTPSQEIIIQSNPITPTTTTFVSTIQTNTSTPVTVSGSTVTQNSGNGTLSFYVTATGGSNVVGGAANGADSVADSQEPNNPENILLASLHLYDYQHAVPGQVLLSKADYDLGILLYVFALENNRIAVQYYALSDGALLSNMIIQY